VPNPSKRKHNANEQAKYQRIASAHVPKPPLARNLVTAFAVGGIICAVGQGVLNYFVSSGMTFDEAIAPTLCVMIALSALLTATSIYHHIGEFAGAGAAIPITGFANTIVAAAMDFKREGYILGMGAKMFIIAGPVIVYGVVSGVIVSAIRWLSR
jgi:stage V sporulation protein AC